MRKANEIIRDRKLINEKLTQVEIDFNKINYVKKQHKGKIRVLEKQKLHTTETAKEDLVTILNKKTKSLNRHILKLKKTKTKKYDDLNKRKSHIHAEEGKISRRKKQIKLLQKKIKRNSKISKESIINDIKKLEAKLNSLKPELEARKEKVYVLRKKSKSLWREWIELYPELNDGNILSIKNLDIFYGSKQVIFDVTMKIPKRKVISIIGPSGCGKSTLLKTINRINDEIPIFRAEGQILLDNEMDVLSLKNIHDLSDTMTLPELRTKIGMVFQQPNPFPMSIFNNVAYGPRINGIKSKSVLKEIVKETLRKSAIYDEVKDNLNVVATGLSGGQQQRLCIARAIANEPDILLMDEPTSALDPIAAKKVEELILELKKDYTIIIVTHSMQQAERLSDWTAFMYQGKLIEYEETKKMFKKPKEQRTADYLSGKFG